MDLRTAMTPERLGSAMRHLDYQPFLLGDDVQTGVAYSWVEVDDARVRPPLLFWRHEWSPEKWERINTLNRSLAGMYDAFIEEVAKRYPGGSLLDVACNNGYFPVRAETLGMHGCAGIDIEARYAESISLLNELNGTNVHFSQAYYNPSAGESPAKTKYDVVAASAIMCHLPDPLQFLAYLGSLANEAVFFWGQMLDTKQFCISFKPPHDALSNPRKFPYAFNDNTRISEGLFRHSMEELGFPNIVEIPSQAGWLWHGQAQAASLDDEMALGSRHRAFLAMRP